MRRYLGAGLLVLLNVVALHGGAVDVAIRPEIGWLNGEAREVVYVFIPARYKISELTWDLSNVPIGGLALDADLNPATSLRVGYRFPLTEGDGDMEDRDWVIYGAAWSDWSLGDARVLDGSILDACLAADLLVRENLRLRGLLGYRSMAWKWEDDGGVFVYSSERGFRDLAGTFPPGVGIRYRQETTIPYIGLSLQVVGNVITWHARLTYSTAARGSSGDEHVLRGFRAEMDFSNGTAYTAALSAEWKIGADLSLTAGVEHESVGELEGDLFIAEATGLQYLIAAGAGLSYDAVSAVLALTWRP